MKKDIVFGKKWFEKHQSKLLWFLNTPLIRVWFRYCLRIYNKEIINKITPNSYTFDGRFIGSKTIELKTDFRTHDKYSKRLYYAFKPFWYLLHFFDWAMLDRIKLASKLSFGFSTLTVYPDAGTGNTTVDGNVRRTVAGGEDWATIRSGAGTLAQDTTDPSNIILYQCHASFAGTFTNLYRFIFTFDTSALTSSATISAAILSIYGVDKNDYSSTAPNVDIYAATPAANNALAASDYSQVGSISQTGSPITYANWSITAYNDFTFDATGRGNISKTGISKFGSRNANYDVANSAPVWSASQFARVQGSTSDHTGTSQDPKLVVTYTLPATGGSEAGLLLRNCQ